MKLKGLILVAAIAALALAVHGSAGTATSVYTVGVLGVPGVDTGLVLTNRQSVTATATGSVCPGVGWCVGPDGDPSIDTTQTSYGGWVLPGAPAWGLVARVGDGPWVQVGSGPTTLSGAGDLTFAVQDEYGAFGDNTGSFTVTLSSSSCWPGNGYGDTNHSHAGPPPDSGCWPGNGYGDKNHDHTGPPGQTNAPSAPGSSSERGGSSTSGSKGKGNPGRP